MKEIKHKSPNNSINLKLSYNEHIRNKKIPITDEQDVDIFTVSDVGKMVVL